MKPYYYLLICLLFAAPFTWAQTTETFETETQSSTTFTDNGQQFTITSQAGGVFDIQGNYAGTGWNGSAVDNRYIDNDSYAAFNTPVQFTISTTSGTAFNLKSMWLFLSSNNLVLQNSPVTITGKLAGANVFTVTASGFNTNINSNNGFSFLNMATFGGQDNANKAIDQYIVTSSGNTGYVALDAMRWQCAPLNVSAASQTNVLCYGGATGAATVVASPGAVTYNWTPGNPAGDGTASVTGLTAGVWTCTVTNSCGSSNATSFTITQPTNALSASTSQTNGLCYGANTGSASVLPSGGTGSYSYAWSPSGGSGATASNLTSGNYTVTITDANGCTLQKSFTITQPASALSATQSQTNVLCYGANTGTATVTASGGTGSYSYAWSPSGGSGASASNLTSGNYTVTITDGNGCTVQKSVTITQPANALTATTSQTNVLCYGNNTGTASVSPSGGTGSYSYSWSPSGGSGATASNLTSGNYTVTITDANGCTLQKNFTITQPASALSATQSQTNVLCNGGSSGTATVVASGGTGSYSYSWLPSGGSGATASNLAQGNYTVTITDGIGCTLQKSFAITQPANALAASTSQTNVLCFGNNTGSATVTTSGGTGQYSYLWSPFGGSGATASNLAAGNYTVTITDANGCTLQKSITITQPANALAATTAQTNILCYGNSTGSATVTASGGTGSYSYSWSPSGGSGATANNLAAGNYTVTITDANACSLQKSVTITQPAAALSATGSQTNVSCNGGYNGTATVTPSGGTGPYIYSWSPYGGNDATATGLSPGSYTVTVTDANNCTTQHNFTITQPDTALAATLSKTDVLCYGAFTGSATTAASGGTGSYSYSWSPVGGNAATATGLAAGTYTVTVSDANGCSVQEEVTITQPSEIEVYISPAYTGCDDTGTAYADAYGGAGYFTYSWAPYGGNEAQSTALEVGTYTVTVTDANGCSVQKNVTVNEGTECSSSTYWNGTEWSNGAPTCFNVTAVIFGDYNSAVNGEITACTLMVNSGTVVVAPGDNFTIKGSVYLEGGTLIFEDNSNLIQIDNASNFGNIIFKRNSAAVYGKDYTIWSSPVSGSQTLKDFSEQTLDERFYVYNTELGAYSNYQSASGIFGGNPDEVNFETGKGYLIRMPYGLSETTTSVFEGTFSGTPNNGEITVPVIGTGSRYNAVGNPYPSPINVQDFMMENEDLLDNGTLYFWRKKNGASGTAYATITLAAFVAANQQAEDAAGNAFADGNEADWVINPGQGFHVKAAENANHILFTNGMRRAVNNGQFFKSANVTQQDMSKMWLNMAGSAGEFGQAALVYSNATTTGLDYGYDGRLFNDGVIAIYTLAEDIRLAIQARSSFEANDEVPLGYKATTAGSYSISLDHVTGVFAEGQEIYLRDNILSATHNLSTSGAYTFATEAGTINDRFDIIYAEALSTDITQENSNQIMIWKNGDVVSVSSGNVEMNRVKVLDIRGRLLYDSSILHTSSLEINSLIAEQQMLIVQVTTASGTTVTKKIIF